MACEIFLIRLQGGHMGANLDNKKQVVAKIVEDLKDRKSIVFVDYRGINVSEDTAMRHEFRENNVEYRVYKNRLLVRALQELGITGFDSKAFEGTTAVCFGDDEVAPARIFCSNADKINKMEVKFGIVNGTIMSKAQIEALSKIPSKEVLIAQLLGQLQAPISAFARVLNAIAEKQN